MSTRFTKVGDDNNSLATGYENPNVPEDIHIPACTIEDVDRALFNLFNEQIPLFYKLGNEMRRMPVIFATGERFAILRRKRPLRDKAGALILPLISIQRTGISQDGSRGFGVGDLGPQIIKKRLAKSDINYQRWINKFGLKHQDNAVASEHKLSGKGKGTKPGQIATRDATPMVGLEYRQGRLLKKDLGKNIFEIITLPPAKFFQANYEVVFWTQYTQQMNDMLTAVMSSYQDMRKRTFRLETTEGYWFVAYVGSDFSSQTNFDDFSAEERIVKYQFNVEVPAFTVAAHTPGMPNPVRSYETSPKVVFEMLGVNNELETAPKGGIFSGDPGKYTLQDMNQPDDLLPADYINQDGTATVDPRVLRKGINAPHLSSVTIGGATAGKLSFRTLSLSIDPFTGERYGASNRPVVVTKGEAGYKDLDSGETSPAVEPLGNIVDNIEAGDVS